jgi:hypothetical protein
MNSIKKFFDFNYASIWNFGLRLGLVSFIVTVLYFLLSKLSSSHIRIENTELLILIALIPYSFYLYRYKSNIVLTWVGYIKVGAFYTFFYVLFVTLIGIFFKFYGEPWSQILLLLIGIFYSVVLGIFFEKSPVKVKIKKIVSLILFVWAIYNIIRYFTSDDAKGSLDTNGDGKDDSFDTDGDGIVDTVFIDSDGDGINDMVALDTNHDGKIDTVALDTDQDGKIDMIVADTDRNGDIDTIIT